MPLNGDLLCQFGNKLLEPPVTDERPKEALRRLQARLGDDDIDDLIRLAYGSQDFREGMAAFLAKRAPKWSGT